VERKGVEPRAQRIVEHLCLRADAFVRLVGSGIVASAHIKPYVFVCIGTFGRVLHLSVAKVRLMIRNADCVSRCYVPFARQRGHAV
jgi:hypothetical protein